MANPLDQFKIKPILNLPEIGGLDISYTNSSLFMTIAVAITFLLTVTAMKGAALVPGRWQALSEMYYKFVGNILETNCGKEAHKFFPFIFAIFSFVLFGNLLGMLPFSFTFTSHIAVTFALAAFIFVVITVYGFVKHGTHFLSLFLPHGTPLFMVPVLVPIEIFSYFVRPVTLSVRLFANMMAGHVLLKVIGGFVATLGIFGIFPILLSSVFIGFEIFVAGLQAYIFTLLTCVYLRDAIHLH